MTPESARPIEPRSAALDLQATPIERAESHGADRSSGALVRAGGAAAIIGGCLAIVAAVLLALQPQGCIGAECSSRPMRLTPPGIAVIGVTATLLIGIGMAGLARLATRTRSDLSLARAVRICGAAGLTVLFVSLFVQTAFFDGDLLLMPVAVAVAGVLILVGLALLIGLVLRNRALPRWLTIAFGASCLVALLLNEQTAAILFVVPFALTTVAIGVFMARGVAAAT